MTTYTFYDEFTVEIRGESDVLDKLRATYEYFESSQDAPPDVVCEALTEDPTPDVVLGGDEDYYGRAGDTFVISRPWGEQMVIDEDWSRIAISSDTVHHHAAYILEFEIRKRLAQRGRAMIHASGVQVDGQTLVFPAWRHAGKTNTMLSLLRSGGDYLSDDRLWVESDGTVTGYPLPINVIPSKQESFEDPADTNRFDRVRAGVSDFVLDRVDVDRSFVDKVIYFLTKYYVDLDSESKLVSIDTLVPGTEFVSGSAPPDALVLLRTSLEPFDGDIEVREISPEDALTDIVNVNYYEWNRRLLEYFMAYDTLFGRNRAGELESLINEETRIVSRLLERTPTYRAQIPRSRDWTDTGIEEAIVEQLGQFERSTSPGVVGSSPTER